MKCPFCSHRETEVIETRETGEEITRRRRQCEKCKKRFTTYERMESFSLRVIKKDGNREAYDREKVRRGFLRACEKRPVSIAEIDAAVDEIEKILRNSNVSEVKSSLIGDLVMKKMKKLDSVAYIRFASVYRSFQDIGEFEKEVKLLKNGSQAKIGGHAKIKLSKNKKRD